MKKKSMWNKWIYKKSKDSIINVEINDETESKIKIIVILYRWIYKSNLKEC